MENTEILFEKIKKASENAELKSFDAMENVWARVEEKLDGKEEKKVLPLWKNLEENKRRKLFGIIDYPNFLKNGMPTKQLAIAASILLAFFLSYQFYTTDNLPVKKNKLTENAFSEKSTEILSEKNKIEKSKKSNELIAKKESNASKIHVDNDYQEKAEIVYDEQAATFNGNPSTKSEEIVKIYPKIPIEEQNSGLYIIPNIATSNIPINTNNMVMGKVTNKFGVGIPGSSVAIKGTTQGVVANANGEFTINAEKFDRLVVSSIGYKSDELLVTDFEKKNIVLYKDIITLNEVVITGYKISEKKTFLGSVSVIRQSAMPNSYAPKNQETSGIIRISKSDLQKFKESINVDPNHHLPWPEKTTSEEYDQFVENQFESPKVTPLSTFSIDVDNASYTNVRRFINLGQKVPKDAVRVEEMVNFFKYVYPQPVDNQPFSINTEYSDSPWNANHKLLRIGLQGKNIPTESLPNSNLVFLIDVSGSMAEENKLPLLKKSMKILVDELRKEDKVSIVVYAGAAGLVLKPTPGNEKKTIIESLEKLEAGGSTAGGAGIELAYKTAEENFLEGGNNRVIIATDGDFNVGVSAKGDVQDLIEEKRKSGVFLTCLGFGMGNYKDVTLETLADKGNGNYAYIDNIQEANRFLGKEFKGSMFAIAKDVKIQIEFNPSQVVAYRLIGYENRKLKAEDFKNDKIDAGELGSGHTVTAFYEIIPAGVESDYIQPDLKYTKTEASKANLGNELATVKFRYKKPDGNKSTELVKVIDNKAVAINNTSKDFQFSTAVAWFGLKLRASKLISNSDMDAIKDLAKKGIFNDTEGYRAEFIRLVEAAK